MENLVGKYLHTQWIHNEGFQSNWLRRITRQTKTQYICDVQHSLLLSDKYKKIIDSTGEYFYGLFADWAKRFTEKDGKIRRQTTNRDNTDGVNTINLVTDFKSLLCKYKYNELFEVDIRTILTDDSLTLDYSNMYFNRYNELRPGIYDERDFFVFDTELISFDDDIWGETAKHLTELFGVPAYKVDELYNRIDTTHDHTIYKYSATHYHINHHGNDAKVIGFEDHQKNRTVSFWLFEDRIVFKTNDGIDTW